MKVIEELGQTVQIKNKVFRDVKSGKIQITRAESFANYAEATIDDKKSLYLPEDEVFDDQATLRMHQKFLVR